jgi:hypothetical protein
MVTSSAYSVVVSVPATNLYFARVHCAVAQLIYQEHSPAQHSVVGDGRSGLLPRPIVAIFKHFAHAWLRVYIAPKQRPRSALAPCFAIPLRDDNADRLPS